jgi:hypothetical protein
VFSRARVPQRSHGRLRGEHRARNLERILAAGRDRFFQQREETGGDLGRAGIAIGRNRVRALDKRKAITWSCVKRIGHQPMLAPTRASSAQRYFNCNERRYSFRSAIRWVTTSLSPLSAWNVVPHTGISLLPWAG